MPRAFNDFPFTHPIVAVTQRTLFLFTHREIFYLFMLSCTYSKIYYVTFDAETIAEVKLKRSAMVAKVCTQIREFPSCLKSK